MDTLLDTLNTKIQKLDAFRQEHARLVFLNHRINELDVLIGSDKNPKNLDAVERAVLLPLRESTLASYQNLEKELDVLGLLEKEALEEAKAEVEKNARVLAGEEPLTDKEKFTLGVALVALSGFAMTASYFVGGYLGYVFGL